MSSPRLDVSALVAALEARRTQQGLSWREVGRRSGVSASTLSRIQQGKLPDVNTFSALVHWLGVPAGAFLGETGSSAPLLLPLSALLGSRPLTPEQVAAFSEFVRSGQRFFKLLG